MIPKRVATHPGRAHTLMDENGHTFAIVLAVWSDADGQPTRKVNDEARANAEAAEEVARRYKAHNTLVAIARRAATPDVGAPPCGPACRCLKCQAAEALNQLKET